MDKRGQKMREIEKTCRALIENLLDVILILDKEGSIAWSNPAVRRYGIEPQDVIGRSAFQHVHPEDTDRVGDALAEALGNPGKTVALAGIRIIHSGCRTLHFDQTITYLPDTPGINGTVVVAHDITDRKSAEEPLLKSEAKYRSLVESAHDSIFTSDATGRFLYANKAAAATVGATPEDVVGKSVDDFFPARLAEHYRAEVARVIRTGEDLIAEDESEIGGRPVWFSTIVQPVRDPQGRVIGAQMSSRDITSLKHAERALRANEERLRQVIRLSHIGIFDHDHLTGEMYWSPEQREIYGWGADEPVFFSHSPGTSWHHWDPIHPQDRERVAAAVKRAHESEDGLYEIQHRILRRDGSLRWLAIRSQTFFAGTGDTRRAVRTIGAVQDITERRLADRQLQLTQSSIDKCNSAIYWVSVSGQVMYANDQACEGLGLARGELIGLHVWEFDPDVPQERWPSVWKTLEQDKSLTLQTRHRRKDGTTFPIEAIGTHVVFEGEQLIFVFAQDITERQRAERELQLMHAAIATNRTPFFSIDPQGRIIYANEHACQSLGFMREELVGRHVWDIDPNFAPGAQPAYWESIKKAGMLRFESRHRRKDGCTIPVEITTNYFSFKGEEFSLAFAQDITERKRVEQALRRSEERLLQVVLVYDIGTFEHDHSTDTLYWSPELRKYWSLSADEPVPPSRVANSIHPEDRPRIDDAVRRAHDPAGEGRYEAQHRIVRPDGSIRWLDTRSQTFFEGEGSARRPAHTIGAMVDVTARVTAEEALRDSLHEKDTLLREVHHRVKNNLQIIASVLHFQAKKIKDPDDLAAFSEGRDRLRSMILVHEKLYQSRDLSRIDFGGYLKALVRDLRRSYATAGGRIDVRVTADELEVPIEAALPCGMIVCELLTNVFKYAFPGTRSGKALVALSARDGRVSLTVSDDGVGLPPDFDPERSTSFGWQLVRNLTAQLDGTSTIERDRGTQVTISFINRQPSP